MRVRRPSHRPAKRPSRASERDAAPTLPAQVLRLQRTAGNLAVARALRHDEESLGALVYKEGSDDGDEVKLETALAAVYEAAPALRSQDATVRAKLGEYADDEPPDLVYNDGAGLVAWLADEGITAGEEENDDGDGGTVEETGTGGGTTDEESGETEGQTVGKLFFPGDTYHTSVKKAVLDTIGRDKLSLLVYGDSDHHNFNLWFEKSGDIYADVNSTRNSKGVWTGYRWQGGKAVKIEDVRRRKGKKEKKGKGNW